MVEEQQAPASEASSVGLPPSAVGNEETLGEAQTSIETTVESGAQGGTESVCNSNNGNSNDEIPVVVDDEEREKTLEFAQELAERGAQALKENDFSEAADCFSRSLEIRVAHFGELGFECLNAYYQFGNTLLCKAQEEADPLGVVPKKEAQESDTNGAICAGNGESLASGSDKAGEDGSSVQQEGAVDVSGADKEEDDEDLAEAEEDEPDLDLAWKMLDIARAIAEKHSPDSMEAVNILSALAEVSLEREDFESSQNDYEKALSILVRLVEPDSRLVAELNFRLCLCLEVASKPQEAIVYCEKAISICKARLQRLINELKGSSVSPAASESSTASQTCKSETDKQAEIETLTGLSDDLQKKLEDLQQLALNPLSEMLAMLADKAKSNNNGGASSTAMSSSQMGTVTANHGLESTSSTVSTANTNMGGGVTHLGVVGRGVKRVLMNTTSAELSPAKKPTLEPSEKPTLEPSEKPTLEPSADKIDG